MMRTIHLHGALAQEYGESFKLDVQTAGEAVRALCANFPKITQSFADGIWHIVLGDTEKGVSLDEAQIGGFRLGKQDLHILPYIAGSKRGGLMKAVLGIALIGVSFGFAGALSGAIAPSLMGATTWGNAIGMVGLSMALSGVSTMLTPEQTDDTKDQSSLLSGSSGSAREGTGLPIIYGEVITGGLLISAGLDIDGTDPKKVSLGPLATVLQKFFNREPDQ